MRWWMAALGLIACGGHTPPERLPEVPVTTPPPVAHRPLHDAPAASLTAAAPLTWTSLGIDGETWRQRVEEIPPAERAPMAMLLLDAGGFACSAVHTLDSCSGLAVPPPTSDSTIEDPCLRRELALWSLDQLDDDSLYEMYDVMVRLVRVPPPERALTNAVLDRFKTGYAAAELMWEAKAVGHKALPKRSLIGAMDDDELREAAKELHDDDAVLALTPEDDPTLYMLAADDDYLLLSTRLEVIARLVAALPRLQDVDQELVWGTLRGLARSRNCTIAAAAVAATAKLAEDRAAAPIGPFTDVDSVIGATCANLAMGARGRPWKTLISKHGIDVSTEREEPFRVDALWSKYPFAYDDDEDGAPDVPEADPDGDGDVATSRETTSRRWHARFTLPFAEELKLALPHCEGTVCRIPDSSVWFQLDIGKERGTKLRLRGIERHETIGSDC